VVAMRRRVKCSIRDRLGKTRQLHQQTFLVLLGELICQESGNFSRHLGRVCSQDQGNKQGNIPPPSIGRPAKISPRKKDFLTRQFNKGLMKTPHDGQLFAQTTDGVRVRFQSIRRSLQEKEIRAFIQ
jgi:hypothetical protein